jgi:hypothetical protein
MASLSVLRANFFGGGFKMATYQGHPCKKCCGTLRFVTDKKCVMCVRERDRKRNKTPKRRQRDKDRAKLQHRKAFQAALRASGYHNEWQRNDWLRDPRKRLLRKARERAKMYDRECTLTIADIVIPERCPLLGIPLFVGTRQVKGNSPTLDRKDSSLGYVPNNVWVISWRANRIKADGTLEEFKLIVKNWPCTT